MKGLTGSKGSCVLQKWSGRNLNTLKDKIVESGSPAELILRELPGKKQTFKDWHGILSVLRMDDIFFLISYENNFRF